MPFWASDPKELGVKTINARAETVAERPAYRDAFESRRCLILADGFYEWSGGVAALDHARRTASRSRSRDCGRRGARRAPSRDVEPLRSCSIVTTAAAGPVRALHDRMPVILAGAEQESLWIGGGTAVDRAARAVPARVGARHSSFARSAAR